MKKWISYPHALWTCITLFTMFALFHMAVLISMYFFDALPLDYLWGGRMETKQQLFGFEWLSFILMLLFLGVVMVHSGYIRLPALHKFTRVTLWFMALIFLLNTVGNLAAETSFERWMSLPTLILFAGCWRMALGKSAT